MERVERLIAHIDEGLILSHSDQIARRRLALLLFDSAVELMMYREATYLLNQEELIKQTIRLHDHAVEHGFEPSDDDRSRMERARQKVTSAKKRREIERVFDAKAAFLADAGLVQPALVRVLKRLHAYRNEAYHRDLLRSESLDSALRIYVLVICDLLQSLPIHSLGYSGNSRVPPTVAAYLGDEYRVNFDTYRKLACAILDREELSTRFALAEALSDHFANRLSEFEEGLEFVADWMSEVRIDGPWNRDDVLALVQLKGDTRGPFLTRHDVRSSSLPVVRSHLDGWRKAVSQLRCESDEVVAFATFADLEDAFEPIEGKVGEMVASVDWAIQGEIDRMRGK